VRVCEGYQISGLVSRLLFLGGRGVRVFIEAAENDGLPASPNSNLT
jgi:hypothetical protein